MGNHFGQQRRNSVPNELNFFAVIPPKPEVERKGLERRTLPNRQWAILRGVQKIAESATSDCFGRFVRTKAPYACRWSAAFFTRGSVHHAPKGPLFIAFVPQLLG